MYETLLAAIAKTKPTEDDCPCTIDNLSITLGQAQLMDLGIESGNGDLTATAHCKRCRNDGCLFIKIEPITIDEKTVEPTNDGYVAYGNELQEFPVEQAKADFAAEVERMLGQFKA